jgi:hypothetical protein
MLKENNQHLQPYLISNINDLPEKQRRLLGHTGQRIPPAHGRTSPGTAFPAGWQYTRGQTGHCAPWADADHRDSGRGSLLPGRR